MIVKRKGNDKASEIMTAAPAGAPVVKRTPSAEYAEALNATVYMVVSLALARAMTMGKRTNAVKGSIFGQFATFDRAMKFREDECKRYAPCGRNMETGKMESMRVYTGVVVEMVNGQATIVT